MSVCDVCGMPVGHQGWCPVIDTCECGAKRTPGGGYKHAETCPTVVVQPGPVVEDVAPPIVARCPSCNGIMRKNGGFAHATTCEVVLQKQRDLGLL